ncbi:syndecan-4 isoform X2 [Melanotaenia boesemani]|uniref:syndecan-4 isoform X2 n=1 Tax=Melanotaenia boesemani TaxID=1250792 RepID=UPI001C05E844|nr:syndecan-4 isoform X2 [Melanotaenia boesemani]
MISLCLVLLLSASVFSESVRETETWMPMKTTQTVASTTRDGDLEASGDSSNGSDFGFADDEDEYYTEYDDDEDEYSEFSGSGAGATTVSPAAASRPSTKPDANANKIPELTRPVRPTVSEVEIVQKSNEIPLQKNHEEPSSNVLMSRGDDNILHKTWVLAALITAGAVCLMFATLLIFFLIYRMKKKDEGSYDLGKKPIYKKAPTTEIYA